jgi:hypothetical protein
VTDPAVELGMMQARDAYQMVVDDEGGTLEALTNTAAWADVAYDALTKNGVGALHASSLILATIHTNLVAKVMAPAGDA